MKQKSNYTLYFLRTMILVLVIWLSTAVLSPAVNSNELVFQEAIIQNQLTNNHLLYKSAKNLIDDLKELTNKRPDDDILPNTYLLVEKRCHLALDTLKGIFSNLDLSNQECTSQIAATRKQLDQSIWAILETFEKESPIITEEEINHFNARLPRSSYVMNTQNRDFVKSLIIGEIELIKAMFGWFVSGRFCANGLVFDNFYPIIKTSVFKKNQRSSIEILFAPNDGIAHSKSLNINDTSIPFIYGVAHYETNFKDSLAKPLIVKGKFKKPHTNEFINIQDTFIISPILKH